MRFDWGGFIICITSILITLIVALDFGYKWGKSESEERLYSLCKNTNGKYDFCIEEKKWIIKEEK